MTQFEWDSALETGNVVIDDQHRGLFALANQLADAVAACSLDETERCEGDEDALANAIYGLTDYCVEHFADEESLMGAAGYPELPTHRSLHEQLSGETLKHAAKYFNDEGEVSEDLAPLFAEWLSNHIRQEDLRFAAWLRERSTIIRA